MKNFEFIPHQADIAFRARGKSLEELFENAALALVASAESVPLTTYHRKESKECLFHADSPEELLILFLNEIRYWLVAKNLLFTDILITIETQKGFDLKLFAKVVPCKTRREIKAVTYHGLRILQRKKVLSVRVTLDV
ncbi:MAG: archease [Candidatus Ratteibacteria bacterium]|jgi:SHS2 domain-containing protein